jgi:hypothetical protein
VFRSQFTAGVGSQHDDVGWCRWGGEWGG